MAHKEPEEERKEKMEPTEVSETRYMGEGGPGRSEEPVEVSETAYMGEPEERNESKHEHEYNEGRQGPKLGKATLETHEKHGHEEKKESA